MTETEEKDSQEHFLTAPNAVTVSNLLTGFLSILMSSYDHYASAAWLILLAFFWDSMDGTIARAFRKQSALGAQLDSLADLVSFIIAPMALVARFFSLAYHPAVFLPVALFYIVAGAYRLARFNISPRTRVFFQGLPSSASGFTLASFLLVCIKNGQDHVPFCLKEFVFMILALSFLMASKIPYPKTSSLAFIRWRFFLLADILTGMIVTVCFRIEMGFSAFALFFIVLAPFYCFTNRSAFSVKFQYFQQKAKKICT